MQWLVLAIWLLVSRPPPSLSSFICFPATSRFSSSLFISPPSFLPFRPSSSFLFHSLLTCLLSLPLRHAPSSSPLLSCFQLVHPVHWPHGYMHIQWSYSGLCGTLLCLCKCVSVCVCVCVVSKYCTSVGVGGTLVFYAVLFINSHSSLPPLFPSHLTHWCRRTTWPLAIPLGLLVVCLCACVPAYVYVFVHICMCVCVCVCVHTCACVCTRVRVCVHTCACVCTCVRVCAHVCMCCVQVLAADSQQGPCVRMGWLSETGIARVQPQNGRHHIMWLPCDSHVTGAHFHNDIIIWDWYMLDEIFATLCVCTAHKFHCSIVIEHCFCMGCHSGQNYAFTILGNLAVSLFNLLSGTSNL